MTLSARIVLPLLALFTYVVLRHSGGGLLLLTAGGSSWARHDHPAGSHNPTIGLIHGDNAADKTGRTSGETSVHGRAGGGQTGEGGEAMEGEEEEEITRPVFLTIALLGGRLGNTLFQLASLLGIAYTQRMTPVMRYDQSLNQKLNTSHALVMVDSVTGLAEQLGFHFEMFTEAGCCRYDESTAVAFDDDVVLYGYFQSWRYFADIEPDLRQIFALKSSVSDQARFFLEMQTPPAWTPGAYIRVGVHVRRGDMNNPKKKQFGYTLAPLEYYLKAMKHYRSSFNETKILFVVCTDDLEWAKESIQGNDVIYSTVDNEDVDLALLSLCDHVIISTGSFSWWAGWFSKGQVVYYKDWPANGSSLAKQVVAEDYFKPEWEPMSV